MFADGLEIKFYSILVLKSEIGPLEADNFFLQMVFQSLVILFCNSNYIGLNYKTAFGINFGL